MPLSPTPLSTLPPPPFPAAALYKRLLALMYDSLMLMAISVAYSAAATLLMVAMGTEDSGDYQPMQHGVWFQLGWLATLVAFYWFFFKRAGQTIGMQAWRLKLVDRDGGSLSHRQVLIRIAMGPIALGAVGLGYLWCLVNQERAAWHDLASSTRIVQLPKKKPNT